MAAILFNTLNCDSQFCNIKTKQNLILKSCYTFGMPRFGNSEASKNLVSPFQIYNANDIIPIIPPKWLGYRNSPEEYRLLPYQINKSPNSGRFTFFRFIKLINGRDLCEHSIDLYSNRLKSQI
jgi:hypothetical protein